jgi:lipopolysaccharide export system permease protein
MRILDRQRFGNFFKAYVICFIALVGLYVVFDAVSNVDEFAKIHDGTLGLLRRMGRYYLVRTSLFYDRLCGVIGMMAAIFTVTWMQRDNELVAMLAAGISAQRVIRPVLLASVVVSCLAILNQEFIIPEIAAELQLPPDDDGMKGLRVYSHTDVNEIRIHGKDGFRSHSTVDKFHATLPDSRFGELHDLQADEAQYIPPTARRCPYRGGWLLRNAVLQPAGSEPDGTLLVEVEPEDLAEFPKGRIPDDKVRGKSYFLHTNLTFTMATRNLQWYQYASTPSLVQALGDPIGEIEKTGIGVFLHGRILRPGLSIALLMISLPIVMGGGARGMFINLGMSLGTSAVFYCVLFLFNYLGNNRAMGVTPELASWIPLIGFGSLAALRWDQIRT